VVPGKRDGLSFARSAHTSRPPVAPDDPAVRASATQPGGVAGICVLSSLEGRKMWRGTPRMFGGTSTSKVERFRFKRPGPRVHSMRGRPATRQFARAGDVVHFARPMSEGSGTRIPIALRGKRSLRVRSPPAILHTGEWLTITPSSNFGPSRLANCGNESREVPGEKPGTSPDMWVGMSVASVSEWCGCAGAPETSAAQKRVGRGTERASENPTRSARGRE